MDVDLDTLATALYVKADGLLKTFPEWVPPRPRVGFATKICDAELVTLAVMQALLGYTSEAGWLRHARAHLRHLFPYLPQQPGYNKRRRALTGTVHWMIGVLARDTSVFTDDVWVVDSTPVECARSRETVKRSDLAGWAEYGYCASHFRFFWGLRLHLLCTLHGLPIGFALTGAKADERQVLLDILHADPTLTDRPAQLRSATRTTSARSSKPSCPRPTSSCCARLARARPNVRAPGSSNPCARSSNPSTTPSRANSTSTSTADAPAPASSSVSANASSP